MDITTVSQIVGTVGFPIAMCLAMGWFIVKQTDTHKEESEKMTDAINNNTLTMQKLCDKLGGNE